MKEKLITFFSITFWVSLLLACVFCPLYFTGVIGRPLNVGDYYIDDYQSDNPFIAHDTNVVLAIKNGYIQFSNSKGCWTSDVSTFRANHTYVGHVSPPKPPVEDP